MGEDLMRLLLVGNPNCGKTTLFNALTGSQQRVGNWPGVTVEKKTGYFYLDKQQIELIDLPGIYSLAAAESTSIDEQIAATAIIELEPDLIINVIDACHLERHLYLSSQILELGKPVIFVLNMMDLAKQQGIDIDLNALAKELNCPVVPIQAHKKIGFVELFQTIREYSLEAEPLDLSLSAVIKKTLLQIETKILKEGIASNTASYLAKRILEGDQVLLSKYLGNEWVWDKEQMEELDVLMADARYQKIHQIVGRIQQKSANTSEFFTAKLDRLILHRFLAFPIFFGLMYLMFLFAINIGGAFQDFFDLSTETLFVQGPAYLLKEFKAPSWLIALIAYGVGKGINTTLTFIPVIAAMFFFLSFLEASGYMARAAFVVDRAMRLLGLPGKSFVPMIVGFGCNVPAILAARTLDSERDRLLTVVMSPFMSCSARLAIYAVFVAAFFPKGGQNIVFSLYLLGIIMAVFTGFILRKTILTGQASPLILELPAYHKPSFKRLLKDTSMRLRHFIIRAGRLIIPICMLLGGANAFHLLWDNSSVSILELLGQYLTPLFTPMGLQEDNWPATVGLLTGMLAKEVVIGTLNSIYAQINHLAPSSSSPFEFWSSFQAALMTIPSNLAALGHAFVNPVIASAPNNELSQSVYGIMAKRFDGKIGAYAYLIFILLYIPCASTIAVIRQEAKSKFMWFSIFWSLLIAYSAAVLFYQLATMASHPQQSLTWVLIIISIISFVYLILRSQGVKYASANS